MMRTPKSAALRNTAVFMSGLLFALGLGISGMTLPQKVIGFLDFGRIGAAVRDSGWGGVWNSDWDPSLALVMVTSAGVYLLLHRLVLRRPAPLFDTRFHVPTDTVVDMPLLVGALLFGVGWGMVGLCPGPALVSIMSGHPWVWLFTAAMLVGMHAETVLRRHRRFVGKRSRHRWLKPARRAAPPRGSYRPCP